MRRPPVLGRARGENASQRRRNVGSEGSFPFAKNAQGQDDRNFWKFMMQRILTALVLIPLVLLLILRSPGPVLAVVAGIVALLAIREFLELTRHYEVEPFSIATYIFVGMAFLFWAPNDVGIVFLAALASLAPFVFLSIGLRRENLRSIYPATAATVFAFAYIAVPMIMLLHLTRFSLIYLMLVVWSGDIFAYFVGKFLGRHKMSPVISPKKTWEGAAASLLTSVFFGTLFYQYSMQINQMLQHFNLLSEYDRWWGLNEWAIWKVILLSATLNVAAQFGDLVESAIKRGADVKDSGSILPGHGGMLDRIDALLFAAPVLWCFCNLRLLVFGHRF